MKKSIFFASALLMLSAHVANAQEDFNSNSTSGGTSTEPAAATDLRSKRGFAILPEAGEYALGISATGTANFFGNLINGTGSSSTFAYSTTPFSLNSNPGMGQQLFLKKFVTPTMAYRVRLQLVANSSTNSYYTALDELSPDQAYPKYVTDHQTSKATGVLVAAGIEKRRGKHRVQGVYGGEAYIGFSSSSVSYNYGNPFSSNFPFPTIGIGTYNATGGRTVKQKNGMGFGIGVRPYIGVEYFFAPKISIGGEFGYTLGATFVGTGSVTSERWNPATQSVDEIVSEPATNSDAFRSIGLSTDNLGGSLNLLFHF